MTAFVREAAVWALAGRDRSRPYWGQQFGPQLEIESALSLSPSGLVVTTAERFFVALQEDHRSYLLPHLVPLLASSEDRLIAPLLKSMRVDREFWQRGYEAFLDHHRLHLRDHWTLERVALAMAAIFDGFMLQQRIQPNEYGIEATRNSRGVSLFGETILAFSASVVDMDGRDFRDVFPLYEGIRQTASDSLDSARG